MSINILINKFSFYLLQASLLLVPLYFNKNVLRFRTSQLVSFYFFIILLLFLEGINFIFSRRDKLNVNFNAQPLHHKAIYLFVLILFFSLIISPNRWVSFQDFLLFFSYFALYYVVIKCLKDRKQISAIIHTIFIAALIIAIYTILQYYGWDPFIPEIPKLTSTIGQRNWISNYLFMMMPLAFSFFLIEGKSKKKLIYYAFLILLYLNLIILQSRAIWIVIAIAGIFGIIMLFKLKLGKLFLENKKWLLLLMITLIVISFIYITDNPVNHSTQFIENKLLPVMEGEDFSLHQRLIYLNVIKEMFKDRPLFGLGIGNYKIQYLYYQAEVLQNFPHYLPYYANAQEAHNEYLQLLAEVGFIGLLVFLSILYFFYRKVILFLMKANNSDKEKAIILALLTSIIGFLVHCLFTFPFHVPTLGMTFFGLLGFTIAYLKSIERGDRGEYENENSKNVTNDIKEKSTFSNQKFIFISVIILIFFALFLLNFLVFKPYYAELLYFKGLRHTVDRDNVQALDLFERAYQLNPYDGKNLHALGTAYYKLKNYGKAENFLIKTKHYITDVNTFYNLGLTYKETNRIALAYQEFEMAVYLDPNHMKSYYELGLLDFSNEKYMNAIEKWGKILELDPAFENDYIVKYNIGLTYKKMNMDQEALDYFLEALKEAPVDSSVLEDIKKELLRIDIKNQYQSQTD